MGRRFDAVRRVDSEHNRKQILQALMDRGLDDDQIFDFVLQATGDIESDYNKAQVLARLVREVPMQESRLLDFLEVATTCDSQHQLGEIVDHLRPRERSPRRWAS